MNPITFCSLFSGSSGNASYLEAGEQRLLIDAGLPGRTVLAALADIDVRGDQLTGILVTHEHVDHIRGVGVLSRKYNLPVYANAGTWAAMARGIGEIAYANRRVFETDSDFFIGDIAVTPFPIPHDAREPVGYNFCAMGRKVSVATDLGYVSSHVMQRLEGSEMILIESNHDVDMLRHGSYPAMLKKRILGRYGHLSNADCGSALAALVKAGLRTAYLGHLSQENNRPELAFQTVCGVLQDKGCIVGEDVRVELTYRDRVSMPIAL